MKKLVALAVFIGLVVFTNLITVQLGIVYWLGIATTAGTWFAGFGFVARDRLQETGGRAWVVGAILAGAAISTAFSPQLALASGAAFLVSEFSDYAVYTPLQERNRTGAALLSNTVGALVDSILFLSIAGFPLSLLWSQVLIKVGVTSVFVVGVWAARRRTVSA
jgi:uncharacterized PurR-regulated membrane protein YhhQ (DUF165 family)